MCPHVARSIPISDVGLAVAVEILAEAVPLPIEDLITRRLIERTLRTLIFLGRQAERQMRALTPLIRSTAGPGPVCRLHMPTGSSEI
jgi:hypothetical protein